MRSKLVCGLFTVLAVTVSAGGVAAVQASPAVAGGHGLALAQAATMSSSHGPGAQLWAKRYALDSYLGDASSMAVSPDGRTVFVTGVDVTNDDHNDYLTIAYSTATGGRLWLASYTDPDQRGPYNGIGFPASTAVNPDGSTVYVTGTAGGTTSGVTTPDIIVIAYDAATGAQQWITTYNGPSNKDDRPTGIALNRSGSTVFVTGYSQGKHSGQDYETVAYNAATGARLWANRYNGPRNSTDVTTAIGVSPNGKRVFVTGHSKGKTAKIDGCDSDCWDDYATVAYSTTTGAQLWVKRYNGAADQDDEAFALAVSPHAGALYVTGMAAPSQGAEDYETIAYNVATGARLWSARYTGPELSDTAKSVAVSPDGGTVFVTGRSYGVKSSSDYLTVAYKATTGAQRWAKRYSSPGGRSDEAVATVVSLSGSTVYVTGSSTEKTTGSNYTTIAYNAGTGAWRWGASYNIGPAGVETASAAAVSPTNGRVFVTGSSIGHNLGPSSGEDELATVAYACCAS